MAATQEQLPFLRQLPVRTILRPAAPSVRPEGGRLQATVVMGTVQSSRLGAVVRLPRNAEKQGSGDRRSQGARFARARAAWLLEVCGSCALIVGFLAMALFC